MTLDPDVIAALREQAHQRGQSVKQVLNDAVRAGLSARSGSEGGASAYAVPARPMGLRPGVDLDKALSLAGDLEDAEILHKLALRK